MIRPEQTESLFVYVMNSVAGVQQDYGSGGLVDYLVHHLILKKVAEVTVYVAYAGIHVLADFFQQIPLYIRIFQIQQRYYFVKGLEAYVPVVYVIDVLYVPGNQMLRIASYDGRVKVGVAAGCCDGLLERNQAQVADSQLIYHVHGLQHAFL